MASLAGAAAAQPPEGQEVRQWCAENGLARFADKFIEEGFDTMAGLATMNDEDLEACGVQKRGHKKAALAALDVLKRTRSPSTGPGSGSSSGGGGGEAKQTTSAEVLHSVRGPALLRAIGRELDNINDGRWTVIKYLGGRKGKSAVVLATDTRLGQVAMKAVVCRDASSRRRFEREIIFLKRAAHPNVVSCVDGPFGSEDGTLMFGALQMLGGGSLHQMRAHDETGRLGEPLVIQMAIDVLQGLKFAHSKGIVHRDLKCDNIMSSGDGFKIVDFGIAHMEDTHRHDVSDTMLTSTAALVAPIGTPHYMSPEQFSDQAVGFSTDIWSVGVVMYRSLVGKFPFGPNAKIHTAIHAKILTEMLDRVPNASDNISSIVLKALQKDPTNRYRSASAMLADLKPLLQTKPLPPGCKWHFFICKNEAPGAQAAMVIYHELRARGYKVWISNDVEGPNEDRMRAGVRGSAVFLVYLTKGIFARPWCRDVETHEAVLGRKPIVMLRCTKGEHAFQIGEAEIKKAPRAFRSSRPG